ncbi:MAG: hypothetical protein ACRC8P_00125 [Spiroplasma sp.]
MRFLTWFKKQNWGIKVGYISLVVSIIALALGLILISVANFVPKDSNIHPDTNPLVGNGFEIIFKNGISKFLTSQGYWDFKKDLSVWPGFVSAPLVQLIVGIVFLIIIWPIFAGVALLTLLGGYFKRWLYS